MSNKIKKLMGLSIFSILVIAVLAVTSIAINAPEQEEEKMMTEEEYSTDEDSISPPPLDVWHEAENGWYGREFLIELEPENGERGYIYTPEYLGAMYGGMNYYVTIPEDGTYKIEGIVWKPHCGSDSFFVTVYNHTKCYDVHTGNWVDCYEAYDFGNDNGWGQQIRADWRMEWCGIQSEKWESCYVNHINLYVTPNQVLNPLEYNLDKGEYLVKIEMREDGTKLDKFRFVEVEAIPTAITSEK
jgi:hypothetical protein